MSALTIEPRSDPPKLITHGGWPEQRHLCAADFSFIDWIEKQAAIRQATIFHMGPGLHHQLGHACGSRGLTTLAITNSREEADAYEEWAIANPWLSIWYKLMFGDIYCLNARLLPAELDFALLFHLGEVPDERRKRYSMADDRVVAMMLAGKLRSGGSMVFYRGSSAWDRIEPIAQTLGLSRDFTFDELEFWRKP